jgi:hypothetical protein
VRHSSAGLIYINVFICFAIDNYLAFEVSDAALEIAAGTADEKAKFTLGACTGLSECPG